MKLRYHMYIPVTRRHGNNTGKSSKKGLIAPASQRGNMVGQQRREQFPRQPKAGSRQHSCPGTPAVVTVLTAPDCTKTRRPVLAIQWRSNAAAKKNLKRQAHRCIGSERWESSQTTTAERCMVPYPTEKMEEEAVEVPASEKAQFFNHDNITSAVELQ